MKIKNCFTAFLLTISSLTFSQSLLNYQSGTTIDIQSGASVCADSVIISGTFTGDGTICGLNYSLELTAFIEGFYDASTDLMKSDTITVIIRDTISPFAVVDTYKTLLSSYGTGTFIFPNAQNGKSYYLQATHRNSIETWSVITSPFISGSLTYNFSDEITKAFGNNMPQVDFTPVVFAFYSGDVNQDGFIDLTDVTLVFNDAGSFTSGYIVTDLTGDNNVDLTDLTIAFNNSNAFISKVIP